MSNGSPIFEGLRRAPADCIWKNDSLLTCLPGALRAHLAEAVGLLGSGSVPVAPTMLPFESDIALRPLAHRRAFYVRVPAERGGGYIAIKGSEPTLGEDLGMLVASGIHKAWSTADNMRIIDVFPTREFKVPMAETLREAVGEAVIADELSQAYGRRYGEVPLLPIPLAALRWPDKVANASLDVVGPELHAFAREVVEHQITRGLGCYVYYYPTAPFPRVRDAAAALGDKGSQRFAALSAKEPPLTTVRRWVDLFARIVALGYLPATTTRFALGQVVQAQNVVVGGGFVDVDSVRRTNTFDDWRELVEAYLFSLETFARTIGIYLFDGLGERSTASPVGLCLMWVAQMLGKAVNDDVAQRGGAVDPRVLALPPWGGDLESLLAFAEHYQSAMKGDDFEKIIQSFPA